MVNSKKEGRAATGIPGTSRSRLHVGHPPKLAPDQLDDARRMIVEGEGTVQVARSLGVNPSTLRRLLMKG